MLFRSLILSITFFFFFPYASVCTVTLTVTYLFLYFCLVFWLYLPHSYFSMPPQLFASCLSLSARTPKVSRYPLTCPRSPSSLWLYYPHLFPFPSFVPTKDKYAQKGKGGPMPHPGQYMVGRFLCAFCCVSQTGVRDETETQIVFLFHTGRRPNPNPCLACPCCCCQRALQLPVKRIPPYGANGNLFSKKKKLFPSDDVDRCDNDVLLPVLSTGCR
jgi:hypothetical protein